MSHSHVSPDFTGICFFLDSASRVALAAFALQPLQLMLADEPSNHLDMATIGTLQRSLKPTEWEGALVLSSHDKVCVLRHLCSTPSGGREANGHGL